MKTRYFLISYVYSAKDNSYGFGEQSLRASHSFPSSKDLQNQMIKNVEEDQQGIKVKSVAIINIFEFKNKKDYESYIKK